MRKRLLVVHGSGGPSLSVREVCQGEAFEALLLEGHNSLVQHAAEKRPALILFDTESWKEQVADSLCRLSELKVTRISRKLVLASKANIDDKVNALDAGADDFLLKPVSTRELLARIEAILRVHSHSALEKGDEEVDKVGDLLLYRQSMEVTVGHKRVKLSRVECHLLSYLMDQAGHVVSRVELLENVWLRNNEIDGDRVVDVYVYRLREKIEEDPANPRRLLTKRRGGYVLINA